MKEMQKVNTPRTPKGLIKTTTDLKEKKLFLKNRLGPLKNM